MAAPVVEDQEPFRQKANSSWGFRKLGWAFGLHLWRVEPTPEGDDHPPLRSVALLPFS
jgi:hypothetical protein